MAVSEIKARIAASAEAASRHMGAIKNAADMPDEEMYGHIRSYVLMKFLLGENEESTELDELAVKSIRRAMELSGGDLSKSDVSQGCAGATSAVTKKVLLLLAIQKELNIKFDPSESADIETLRQLSEKIKTLRI